MYYLDLYWQFIKINLKTMIEYRSTTVGVALAEATGFLAEFGIVWVMINQFKTIGGWGPYEVMFLFALNLLSYALASFFLYRLSNRLPGMIQNGTFDEVLTKPTNPFLYLTCSGFSYGYFSHVTVSIAVIVVCFAKLGISVSFQKILYLFIVVLSGALIQGAASIFTSVPCFWLVQNNSLRGFMRSLRNFIQYPISVYSKGIQIILTILLPYAFVNFYPAQYFLGKNDFMMFHPVFQYLSPGVGIILFIGAYKFWNAGIRQYKSTGS